MKRSSRLHAYLTTPLLVFSTSGALFLAIGNGLMEPFTLQLAAGTLAALLAILPALFFHLLIRSQVMEGFAQLDSGELATSGEISLGDILQHRIDTWIPFHQQLQTEVRLQGEERRLYVRLELDFTLPANEAGKRFVQEFDDNMVAFRSAVQQALEEASRYDTEMVKNLYQGTLLNEEDEQVLRSKFLSALEMQPFDLVELPVDTNGIRIDRRVREEKIAPTPREKVVDLFDSEELELDSELVAQLRLNG